MSGETGGYRTIPAVYVVVFLAAARANFSTKDITG
jgi:hypothetical protein